MAMEFKRRLPIPMEIREEMPLSAELTAKKQAYDAEVAKVFTGEDHARCSSSARALPTARIRCLST